MSNENFVKLGQQMWLEMFEMFMTVGHANAADAPEKMAAMWAGYMAAASGSGCQVFGKENMQTILRSIMKSVDEFEPQKPELRVVK